MKVLSVRQPWAWAIIHGGKDIENRNWKTPFRGRLAIHAGTKFDLAQWEFESMAMNNYGPLWAAMCHRFIATYDFIGNEPRGAIIGTVEVVDCITDRLCDSPWKAEGDDFYCWLLANPVALREPIPMKGQLGLWDVPDSLIEEPS